jgi:histidyl-tRNA synthetase
VEAIGSYSPYIDAELIILLNRLLQEYGLKDYEFKINSLGCDKDKESMRELIRKELKHDLNLLCEDCGRRYNTNILRVLDCKNPACRKIVSKISLGSVLCTDCSNDFRILQDTLSDSGIEYEASPLLVRGLDYYTKTVFEVSTGRLGAQDAIAAGGRYDNLVSDLGGEKTGASGFALGMERVIDLLSKSDSGKSYGKAEAVFITTIGDKAQRQGFKLLNELRKSGLTADMDYQAKSLKAQMRYADKIKAKYAVILGEDELKNNTAVLKNMADSSQREVGFDGLITELRKNSC